VVLESKQVTDESAFPVKKMPSRVLSLEKVSHDVMVVKLQLPANRDSVPARSRSPDKGVMPRERNKAKRSGDELSASTRTPRLMRPATRRPTSPQPTMSRRSRRKRDGRAPRGLWIEGKIECSIRQKCPRIQKDDE
jgi:hypothetical protein